MRKLFRSDRFKIASIILLVVGLIALVVLVQRQQVLKSRAQYDIRSTFEVTDPEGNQLNCSDTTCETKIPALTLPIPASFKAFTRSLMGEISSSYAKRVHNLLWSQN